MHPNPASLPIQVTPQSASDSPCGVSSLGLLRVVGGGMGAGDCCFHRCATVEGKKRLVYVGPCSI